MRELPIAYGNSCFAKTWSNKTITWDSLCEKLATTIRTTETVEEYPKLKKADRDRAKDKGGFVAGMLKDNRRKRETVICRSMLTLDADHAEVGFIDRFAKECTYASCLYTTHGHTPLSPRCRIIVPLTRDVSADEYSAIARLFAAKLGIDQFDECSYRPHQLMYWPTTPANGEYIYKCTKGEWLDPDVFLKEYPHWRDCSLLPTSSRESTIRKASQKKQEDPLAKKGIVGAFCRTYGITEAIEKFLLEIYAPSAVEGRYDYIPADSSAGVVVYDDKFSYSHHASDPACGKELNAFDLVRIHLFGDEDDKDTFKQMSELAIADTAVKETLAKERALAANREFDDNSAWETALTIDRSGNIRDTLDNVVLILRNDEQLKNLAYNRHRESIEARGSLPWEQLKEGWSDSDYAALKVYLSKKYGFYTPTKTKDAVLAVASERAFHPVKDYLDNLPDWDGTPRIDTLYIDYFATDDNVYTRAASRKSLVAAVMRIYQPGEKFDCIPILNGPQGVGKSTFFAKLGGKWFSDSLTLADMKDKAGAEKLQGYWILELGELAGMRKADLDNVKSFVTRRDDKYRASYGVYVESHPRQCIIVGSTNAEAGFLRDITGNRRYWPIRVNGKSKKKAWNITKEEVDQIWAEALTAYKRGESVELNAEEERLADLERNFAMETDEREGLVRQFLDTLLPTNWDELDLFERRSFLNGSALGEIGKKGTQKRTRVSNIEIWCECFGKEAANMRKADSYEIAAIMQKIGDWDKSGRENLPIYGRQRVYTRRR